MRRLILENKITPFYKRVLKLLNKKLGEGEDASVVWDILTTELSIDDMDSKIGFDGVFQNLNNVIRFMHRVYAFK